MLLRGSFSYMPGGAAARAKFRRCLCSFESNHGRFDEAAVPTDSGLREFRGSKTKMNTQMLSSNLRSGGLSPATRSAPQTRVNNLQCSPKGQWPKDRWAANIDTPIAGKQHLVTKLQAAIRLGDPTSDNPTGGVCRRQTTAAHAAQSLKLTFLVIRSYCADGRFRVPVGVFGALLASGRSLEQPLPKGCGCIGTFAGIAVRELNLRASGGE